MEDILGTAWMILFPVLVLAALVFWMAAMWQVRKTAKAFEELIEHADETAVVLGRASQKAAGVMSAFESGWAQAVPFLLGLGLAVKNQFSAKANGIAKEKIKNV